MNSKAIVLEVGGILQHGAIVAREFGKPCIVGVDKACTRLKDGDLIRVDAHLGKVTLL
jgi:pyruvate,water dikinase